jgi:hypothetical protein
MPYNEHNENLDLDESGLYDDTSLYEPDTFRERLDNPNMSDQMEDDSMLYDDMDASASTETTDGRLEDDFGETLNTETNPHIDDQLGDDSLHKEAESDYATQSDTNNDSSNDGSLIDKAKDKINDWTDGDKR